MKSSQFLNEGDDKNMNDVEVNHPEIYQFLVKQVGYMSLEQLAVVEAYNTSNSHMVRIAIKPSAGMGNTEAGFRNNGIEYEAMTSPMDGGKVLSGSFGDVHWTVKDDNRHGNITETWLFSMPHEDPEEGQYRDRTMEEVDEGEPEPKREKLSVHDVFGSDEYNILRMEGIKFFEKPSYWSDLERTAIDATGLKTAEFALAEEGIELAEYPAWQIYPIDDMDEWDFVKGPLQSVENMPSERVFVIYDLPYSDERRRGISEPKVGTFLVDRSGAQSYIRHWIMIK